MFSDGADETGCIYEFIKPTIFLTELSFFLLGFDTISTALSWSVLYLVANPEIEQRLFVEISKFLILFHKLILP